MSNTKDYRLRIRGASQLVQVCNRKERVKIGADMDKVVILENAGLIVGHDGKIVAVGSEESIEQEYKSASFDNVWDAQGQCILPGLCDGHSHPVWSGDRCHEFKMKLAGATYNQVHEAGGGINFTVKCTRESSEAELLSLLMNRLQRMKRFGTTLLEAKSGYGLELETEMKMLRVLHQADMKQSIDIVSNFCAAHSVPQGSTAAEATENIIQNMIPEIARLREDGEVNPTLIDVFCEKGYFELKDTEAIIRAGKTIGLDANIHGDELTAIKAAELAADLSATAVSHLEHVSDEGISKMAQAGVVGVLLPTTAYVLRIDPPPARKLIENGVPVALGSDFNPNAHCMSMPHVMNLACVTMNMTMNEALVAATINSAASMNKSDTHGSLEIGKIADMVVLEAQRWEHIIYQQCDPPISAVIKNGLVAYTAD